LVYPGFWEVARHATDIGMVVRIKTNGHLLDESRCHRLMQEVQPFLLEISLHGARAETHERQTRIPGSYHRLLANLETARAAGLRIQLKTALTRWNENEVEGMIVLAEHLGLPIAFDAVVTPRDDGDMSPLVQSKVLRVLQEGEVERLGSSKTIKVDVRVIAATNKDLEEEIAEGRFREDLYFRLSVIPIDVPPLRERLEDIPVLVEHFAEQFSQENNRRLARFAPGAIEALGQARWRGNIRELRNVIERLLIMTDRAVIEAGDVRAVTRPDGRPDSRTAAAVAPVPDRSMTLREYKEWAERAYIVEKLREFSWNISKTAEVIDTPRSNLYKKLEQYKISQDTDER